MEIDKVFQNFTKGPFDLMQPFPALSLSLLKEKILDEVFPGSKQEMIYIQEKQ